MQRKTLALASFLIVLPVAVLIGSALAAPRTSVPGTFRLADSASCNSGSGNSGSGNSGSGNSGSGNSGSGNSGSGNSGSGNSGSGNSGSGNSGSGNSGSGNSGSGNSGSGNSGSGNSGSGNSGSGNTVVPIVASDDSACCSGGGSSVPPAVSGSSGSDAQYFYVTAGNARLLSTNGAEGSFVVADPTVKDCGHSLAEMAVMTTDPRNIVEVGWVVNKGDNPQLFVFAWVRGRPRCYNKCGFVPTSGSPVGQDLTVGSTQDFYVTYSRGNWEIFDNNHEIGYYPGSIWGNKFTKFANVQWFGEVAALPPTDHPCAQMGNGNKPSPGPADTITDISIYRNGEPRHVTLKILAITKPDYYNGKLSGHTLSFGGPGSGC